MEKIQNIGKELAAIEGEVEKLWQRRKTKGGMRGSVFFCYGKRRRSGMFAPPLAYLGQLIHNMPL